MWVWNAGNVQVARLGSAGGGGIHHGVQNVHGWLYRLELENNDETIDILGVHAESGNGVELK
jgi:hypothetical protein